MSEPKMGPFAVVTPWVTVRLWTENDALEQLMMIYHNLRQAAAGSTDPVSATIQTGDGRIIAQLSVLDREGVEIPPPWTGQRTEDQERGA